MFPFIFLSPLSSVSLAAAARSLFTGHWSVRQIAIHFGWHWNFLKEIQMRVLKTEETKQVSGGTLGLLLGWLFGGRGHSSNTGHGQQGGYNNGGHGGGSSCGCGSSRRWSDAVR
jgi:hypothetical protein